MNKNTSTLEHLKKISALAATRTEKHQRWPDEIVNELQRLRKEGVSAVKIAAATGIPVASIYNWTARTRLKSPETENVKVFNVRSGVSFYFRWRQLEIRFR